MATADAAYDAIILGAGAAGLMCALVAGQRGRKVLLLEHTDKAGAKILISGGGRCNFTNLASAPDRFLSGNPHFCTSALRRYTQRDFIDLVRRHGIAFHEKTLGQLFCDGSARSIVAMLLAECAAGGVDVRLGQTVSDVSRAEHFRVVTQSGSFTAPSLVLATGGLSIPKMGATGFSYDVARRFGLRVTQTLPGLAPLKAGEGTIGFDAALAGVALEAVATFDKQSFRENILFTHRGLSGPAILQISSYWRPGEAISIDLLPGLDARALLLERQARAAEVRAADCARRGHAGAPGTGAHGRAPACRRDGQYQRPCPRRFRRGLEALAVPARRDGRLRQGRGDGRRHRHARAVVEDDGGARRSRPLCHRRGRRCDRLAGRL